MKNQTQLKVKVQPSLCLAYETKDDGRFFFVLCRLGLSALMGRRLKTGEEFLIDVAITEVEDGPES